MAFEHFPSDRKTLSSHSRFYFILFHLIFHIMGAAKEIIWFFLPLSPEAYAAWQPERHGFLEDPQWNNLLQPPVSGSMYLCALLWLQGCMCSPVHLPSVWVCQVCVWQSWKRLEWEVGYMRLSSNSDIYYSCVTWVSTDSPVKWIRWYRSSIPQRMSWGSRHKEQKYSLVISKCYWELQLSSLSVRSTS